MDLIIKDKVQQFAKLAIAAGWEWCGVQEAIAPYPPVLVVRQNGHIKTIPLHADNFDPIKTATQYLAPLEKKMTDTPKLNLRQKMIQIYNEIDHVGKYGENTKQHYNFVRAADVMRPVREAFAKYGVYAETNYELLGTYDIKTNSGGNMHTAMVKATIVLHDADSYETLTISGLGDGADSGDKGVYKAMTGATKNALRNGTLLPDEADPEADETVDNNTDGRALNAQAYDMPDFQEARHTAPRPQPAPKAAKTTENPIPEPEPASEAPTANIQQYTDFKGLTEGVQDRTVATPENVPGKGDAYEGPEDTALPTETELTAYRAAFKTLGDDLSTKGELKSNRSLPINRKLLVFLLSVTKAADGKSISKQQWDNFFARVDAAKANPEVGLVGLAKKVNAANGIEEK